MTTEHLVQTDFLKLEMEKNRQNLPWTIYKYKQRLIVYEGKKDLTQENEMVIRIAYERSR